MRARFFPITTLVLAGFAVGVFLGRRWTGDLAGSVLAGVAILTVIAMAIVLFWRRARPNIGNHLVLERRDDQLIVRVQNWWRVELIEFGFVLPRAWLTRVRVRHAPPEPPIPSLLSVARDAIVERPWRGAVLLGAGALTGFMLWQIPGMSRNGNFTGIVIEWFLACVLFALAIVPPHPISRPDLLAWWRHNWKIAGMLSGLTFIAFLLRVWEIGTIPFVLDGDEASFGQEALRVIRGEIGSPFFAGHLSQPTLSFFYDSIAVRLLGPTITAIRLPWALLGTLTIPITFWLVSRLKGPRLGLVTAALLTAYHFHIHYSRLNLNNIADPLFGTLALLFLYRALTRRGSLDWMLAGMACGGALYFYSGARLIPIVFLGVLAYLIVHERMHFWKKYRTGLVIAVGGFLIVAAPILQYAVLFPDEFNGRVNQVSLLGSSWLEVEMQARGQSAAMVLADQFVRSALAFNFYPDVMNFYGLTQPLLDPIFGVLFLLGLGYGTARVFIPGADRRLFPMVAWLWAGIILGGMLTLRPPASMRFVTLTVPVCFFIALAMERFLHLARQAVTRVPVNALMAMGVLLFSAISLKTYFVDFSPLRLAGGLHAEISTELGPTLDQLGPTYRTFFFGAPQMYGGFPTLPFLAPGIQVTDVEQPLVSPPPRDWLAPGRGAVFAFLPHRIQELKFVQATFPNGATQEIRTPRDGEVIVTLYRVLP